jgi:hypothetical protein
MVFIKANLAEGSFLRLGTHVWLEITDHEGKKTTFSGSRSGNCLRVLRDYKRDYDRDAEHGLLDIFPPHGMSEKDWPDVVISAALKIQEEMNEGYAFNGVWPWGKTLAGIPRSNCCGVVRNIIELAGGKIPNGRIKGVLPGLGRGWRDYL